MSFSVLFAFFAILSFSSLNFQFLYLQYSSWLWTFVFHFVWCPLILSRFCSFSPYFGSLSFKESDLLFSSIRKKVVDFSISLRSNLNGFFFFLGGGGGGDFL